MIRDAAQQRLRYLVCAAALALAFAAWSPPASADEAASKQVAAKLVCGSHSANPHKLRPFDLHITFTVSGPLWTSDVKNARGKERFLGILSPSGTMLIVGEGKAEDGATWTYEFSGKKKKDALTILRGSLKSDKPKGQRICSLAF
ncbi:MAG: hypothetical protein P8Y53_12930 [Pseudolabrys sp.]